MVTGDVRLLGADCAEEFDMAPGAAAAPGTVMVIDASGALKPCASAYDRAAAGIVSGASPYRPALTLDHQGESDGARCAIALIGKVSCLVDADRGAIQIGDLLTTSPTPGHAMRVGDPSNATGALIGKALGALREGRGMIPVLVSLL